MTEKMIVNGVEITGAVAKQFVVGKMIELSDGRVIEVRAGKLKFRDAISVGEALGADAAPKDVNLHLACGRLRLKDGGMLTPEDLLDMDLDDANELMEAALGKNFLSRQRPDSQPSSGTGSAPSTSKA